MLHKQYYEGEMTNMENTESKFIWLNSEGAACEIMANGRLARLSWPTVTEIHSKVIIKLRTMGFTANFNYWYGREAYIIQPVDVKFADITLPVFDLFEGIPKETGKTITVKIEIPEQFAEAREKLVLAKQQVKEEQEALFWKLFYENSLDGGITSVIRIESNPLGGDCFDSEYIPNDAICIVKKEDWHVFRMDSGTAVFIKKQDAGKKRVTIKVPEELKGLVIGRGGRNISSIAEEINASFINVT